MAKVHSLKIQNFRGIKNFSQVFGLKDFICIIGRGDSGKSTILEAISLVLSPKWNILFNDNDFYCCNIENSISIEITLYDLPSKLIQENKFGLYIRGIEPSTNCIVDDIADNSKIALTIRLSVDNSLEPKWEVVNERQDPIQINAKDRSLLNVFLVSDYLDKHFSWSNGSPLYSLLKQIDNTDISVEKNIIINALRDAKLEIDHRTFNHLDSIIEKIITGSAELGLEITKPSTTIDFREFTIKDDKMCLHDDNIPLRMKGKGTKRLLSIAIQKELVKAGGIILIDEIEQGLEPDRAQHLAKMLKKTNEGQVFITTHSRDVIVELKADNLFLVSSEKTHLKLMHANLQGCLRRNPEAFFAKRIIICEGATEVGVCRELNENRITKGKDSLALKGIRIVDGNGSNFLNYAENFIDAGFDICVFCDSDVKDINAKKILLSDIGAEIIDCDLEKSLEEQIFSDLPWQGINKLIEYRISESSEESVESCIGKEVGNPIQILDWIKDETTSKRELLGKISSGKRNSKPWFKRIDHGEFLGKICLEYLAEMESKKIANEINALSCWIETC